jgi:hypothetical protein
MTPPIRPDDLGCSQPDDVSVFFVDPPVAKLWLSSIDVFDRTAVKPYNYPRMALTISLIPVRRALYCYS